MRESGATVIPFVRLTCLITFERIVGQRRKWNVPRLGYCHAETLRRPVVPQFRENVKNKQWFRITNAVLHLDGGHRLIDAIIVKEQSDE